MTTTTAPAPLCFVDTETTALHPGRRPWEIALIRRDYADDGNPGSFTETSTLIQVRGVDLTGADPKSLAIGGFYERHHEYRKHLPGLPSSEEVPASPEDVAKYLNHAAARANHLTELAAAQAVEKMTRGAHLVAAVPDFDAHTLAQMLRRHRLIAAWHYHLVDVEAMAAGWLNGRREAGGISDPRTPVSPPWRSDDLSLMCGVIPPDETERHTALGDAEWVKRWYDVVSGRSVVAMTS